MATTTVTTASAPGLVIKPAPDLGQLQDHPEACFVIHAPSNRRFPATWPTPVAAEQFVNAARDLADWTAPTVAATDELVQAALDNGGTIDDFGTPWLPSKPYEPTSAEVAGLLVAADAILTSNGWCQIGHSLDFHDTSQEDDEDLDPAECRVCLRGAVNMAAEGYPEPPEAYEARVLADAATAALARTLGATDVAAWNDQPGRTAADVHGAVARTVNALRTSVR